MKGCRRRLTRGSDSKMPAGKGSETLQVHRMLPRVITLGPGLRLALWVQGCFRRCPGCITPDSRPLDGGRQQTVSEIAAAFLREPGHEGITISGGEPFLQAGALCRLIDLIREQRDCGVIVYTGYTLEELQESGAPEDAAELLRRTDLLIDGPYIRELNDDASLRGSSNQRVICLTERYRNDIGLYGVKDRRDIEIRWTQDGLFIAGIPSKTPVRLQLPERDET